MIVNDKELHKLNDSRQELIRDFDKGYINEETYKQRLKPVEEEINQKVRMLLESQKEQDKKLEEARIKMDEENKTEETAPAEEVKKPGRKVSADTYASVIGKVLMQKSVINMDAAVAKVDELKPGREKKKNVTQIKTIIRLAKAGKGRWANYTWDDTAFLLAEKTA